MLVETSAEGLPTAFLVILVFWLAWLFATFGFRLRRIDSDLRHAGLLAVGGRSGLLVVDMAHPYIGVIHVSDVPLRSALAQDREAVRLRPSYLPKPIRFHTSETSPVPSGLGVDGCSHVPSSASASVLFAPMLLYVTVTYFTGGQ